MPCRKQILYAVDWAFLAASQGGTYGLALFPMDFLFFLLPSDDSPEGIWMRVGDHFAGCVLQVEKAGSELVGRLLVLPEAMTHAGWFVGDLKWRNIEADGPIWRIQDLRKHYDTRTATVTRVDYQEYHLTVGAFGHLRLHTGAQPFFPAQRWVRQQSQKPSIP